MSAQPQWAVWAEYSYSSDVVGVHFRPQVIQMLECKLSGMDGGMATAWAAWVWPHGAWVPASSEGSRAEDLRWLMRERSTLIGGARD